MRRTLPFLLSFILCAQLAKAQYVTIPDSNFRAVLMSQYPNCFNGSGQMDTTCSQIVNATFLACSHANISNLDGIQYFDHLLTLNCNFNHINNVFVALPNSLQQLDISDNQLAFLPALPGSLQELYCSSNQLTYISFLPNTLKVLNCFDNQIINLFPLLPGGLQRLLCFNNLIGNLPPLPNSLRYLMCSVNHLNSLPALPNGLTDLDCSYNYSLDSLPALPNSLTFLRCGVNNLTSLPTLPNTLQTVYCNDNHLSSLPTLPSALQTLDCSHNQLSSLPALSGVLRQLTCYTNQLSVLPNLPNTLQQLNCGANQLSVLPNLPNTLQQLNCSYNNLSSLPNLPNALQQLDCSTNNITSLPVLSSNLQQLNCAVNPINSLPTLPNTLQQLTCRSNQLTALPTLPNTLQNLDCGTNYLTSLPALTTNLIALRCGSNQLASLPALNNTSLYTLECNNNQLTTLPKLPSQIYYLDCYNNSALHCLPYLPNSLHTLILPNTNITCLPNLTSQSFYPYILCPSGQACPGSAFAVGKVYYDANNNNQWDTTEVLLPNRMLTESHSGYTGSSQAYGYNIEIDSLVNDTIRAVPAYPLAQSFSPASRVVYTTHSGQATGSFDFGLHLIPNRNDLQISINSIQPRPGFSYDLYINVENHGSTTPQDTVQLTLPSGWLVNTTSPVANNISNNTIQWQSITGIPLFGSQQYHINITVPTTVLIGTPFTISANCPLANDIVPINNTASFSGIVIGSFDPNEKMVNPSILSPNYTASDEISYTINFQNTGTASALSVMVIDTLPQNVDPSSVHITNASHNPYYLYMDGQRVVRVVFPVINLLDSTHNEPQSHGFVQFSIKPKLGLHLGTTISNRANIYFDYNSPVVTNTATTNISTITTSSTATACNQNTGSATVQILGSGTFGYLWSTGQTTATIQNLAAGNYAITITSSSGSSSFATANVIVAPPFGIQITPHALCLGADSGAIDIQVSNGLPPYTYNWSNGNTTQNLTGLSLGNYAVTITDQNGCSAMSTANIVLPTPISLQEVHSDEICAGDTMGTISIMNTGGAGSYSYNWSNGSTNQNLINLATGTYTATVTDVDGCTASISASIGEPDPILLAAMQTDAICAGSNSGSIDLYTIGGIPFLTYNWSNGSTDRNPTYLTAGTYTVVVTDANGCTATLSTTVSEPTPISITETHLDVSCAGHNDGAIDLTIFGGTALYNYLWSNGSTNEDLTSIVADYYTVTVTDANGCMAIQNVTIQEPSPITINITDIHTQTNVNPDGAITIAVTGGTAGYTYQWSNGETTQNASGLAGGIYSLTITDGNGCTATANQIQVGFLGVKEIGNIQNLSISPNPARDVLSVKVDLDKPESISVALVNVLGQELSHIEKGAAVSTQCDFTVSDFAAGVYFVRITAGADRIIRKVVIE